MKTMEKTGVIDIGSNSVKISVYETGVDVLMQKSLATRLASGFSSDDLCLQPEPVLRTVMAIVDFIDEAKKIGCNKFHLLATEAVRRAENKDVFSSLLYDRTGFQLNILSPEEEAELAAIAASYESGYRDFIMMDTGGASTEFVLVKEGTISETVSFPWGGVTLNSNFSSGVSVDRLEFLRAVTYVTDGLSSLQWLSKAYGLPIVALGGTLRVYDRYSNDYSPAAFAEMLLDLSLDERIRFGIPEDRADIMPVGMIPLIVLSSLLQSGSIKIAKLGIRDGFILKKLNDN